MLAQSYQLWYILQFSFHMEHFGQVDLDFSYFIHRHFKSQNRADSTLST